MPKVSIITTTYKHEKFIAYTIDSILSQSFTDWELLIGDDSPDDTTWNIIQEYIGKYPEKIKAWHHMPNKGIVENTNFLLGKISTDTEYIAFLEGDDMYTPDNLEQKLHIFNTHPEVQLVYSDLSFIDSGNRVIKQTFYNQIMPFSTPVEWGEYFLSGKSIFSYSSMMFRRGIFSTVLIRKIGDKESFVSDFDIVGQVLQIGYVHGINETLTHYRIHTDNISISTSKVASSLYDLLLFLFQENHISVTDFHILSSRILNSIASGYLLEGKRMRAMRYLGLSIIGAPMEQFMRKIITLCALFAPLSWSRQIFRNRFYDAKN